MEPEYSFDNDIRAAVKVLGQGGIILYPTDTVWGIGCDATNVSAVSKVFKIKQRSDSKALITLVDSIVMLERYVDCLPEVAESIIDLSTRPTTIVYDRGINLAANILASDGSVGIRVTKERFSQQLCRMFRKPVVSTSANISGQRTPATYGEIDELILKSVDYVVRYRRDDTSVSLPSAVIKIGNDSTVKILRP